MSTAESAKTETPKRTKRPFRKAVFAGLGVVMPPLLTIVLFLWAWNTIENYVLSPVESTARLVIRWSIMEVRDQAPSGNVYVEEADPDRRQRVTDASMKTWVRVRSSWIPERVYREVEDHPSAIPPVTAIGYYDEYVKLTYLRREVVVPIFVLVFVLVLYFLGKFVAAGIGRMIWNSVESLVTRVPIISNVYSSVKQVTDFAFKEKESDNDLQFTRIVAIQYPRKGLWVIGFLTGDGIPEISKICNEPVVSVLVPTSPMPATGFTIVVPRSEIVELSITVDQAIQFCVSCGVVSPGSVHTGTVTGVESSAALEAIRKQLDAAVVAPTNSPLPSSDLNRPEVQ